MKKKYLVLFALGLISCRPSRQLKTIFEGEPKQDFGRPALQATRTPQMNLKDANATFKRTEFKIRHTR